MVNEFDKNLVSDEEIREMVLFSMGEYHSSSDSPVSHLARWNAECLTRHMRQGNSAAPVFLPDDIAKIRPLLDLNNDFAEKTDVEVVEILNKGLSEAFGDEGPYKYGWRLAYTIYILSVEKKKSFQEVATSRWCQGEIYHRMSELD